MSGWPEVPLSDLCDVRIGRTPRRNDRRYWTNGRHVWVTIRELNGQVIDQSTEQISDEALSIMPEPVAPGTLLFSFKLSIGKMAIAGRPLYTNEAIAALPVRRADILERGYLFHALKRITHEADANHAVLGKVLNKAKVGSIKIPLPPLAEQRRIVDILNRANGIRRLRRDALDKTRQLIPALFIDMFGDPATNPKGWPIRLVREVVGGFEGGRNLQAGPEQIGGYRILKISAVTSGYYRPDESKPAPIEYQPPASHLVRPGDLLFSRANTVDLVGATALVKETPSSILLPDKIWRVLWKSPSPVVPAFLLALFQNASIRRAMAKLATGTSDSMRNISKGRLSLMPVPIPPELLQRQFAERTAEIQATTAQQERMVEASERLVAALMARLFDG